ncbi:MAG: GIY-YIG nuclease family protein [Phycisphaerae bacterium]|nr:GIY-YIG nuclease family protein [Phycisphaerae bacterium]
MGSNPTPSASASSDEVYYVYVLRNSKGRLYIGSSSAPDERLVSHNAGRVRSTKSHRPWSRVLLEEHPDRQAAEKRERYLKSGWGRRWLKASAVPLIALLLCTAAVAEAPPNLLRDPGFDEWVHQPFGEYWKPFGKAFCETITPRSGPFVAKVYGAFDGTRNYSGVYQDVPVEAGERYVASAYLRHNAKDSLQGENEAWLKLEFYGADDEQLSVKESPKRLHAKDAVNKYIFFSTGPVKAPEGSTTGRFVIIFTQAEDDAPGAVLADDASLAELP